jgi:AAA domain
MATAMKISSVFTPRNPEVNLKIYVPRLRLETALLDSVEGSMHSLLFGESGNGKSWLYKKVLEQNGIAFAVANCASASRKKSLTEEIRCVLIPEGTAQKTGYSEKKEATVNAVVATGKLEHQSQYSTMAADPLLQAFEAFSNRNSGRRSVLVIDNIESIFSRPDLMDELADLIILVDDTRFARFNIKLVIVGVPNGVLDYFAKTKNMESVANRLEEVPKIGGLNLALTKSLITKGFNQLLRYEFSLDQIDEIATHTHHVTMGVAQRVHEYCAKFAICYENRGKRYAKEILKEADRQWLTVGLRQCYTVMESHLNGKRTAVARKNQVIYCIGHMKLHQFDSNDIKESLKEYFPNTISDHNMGISAILAELASGENPLLSKNPRTNDYRVSDPRYMMCIRAALSLDPATHSVVKGHFEA